MIIPMQRDVRYAESIARLGEKAAPAAAAADDPLFDAPTEIPDPGVDAALWCETPDEDRADGTDPVPGEAA
ncbi:hypothetical protein [Yinghuangia sp. YIM S09857]|uniref:hypothetical protein n=1 Tax=Yinghuangia sp. YIM S09857 TaxID=3436929 RepID=UPI003F53BBA1